MIKEMCILFWYRTMMCIVGVIILRASALALCTDHFTSQNVPVSFVYICYDKCDIMKWKRENSHLCAGRILGKILLKGEI